MVLWDDIRALEGAVDVLVSRSLLFIFYPTDTSVLARPDVAMPAENGSGRMGRFFAETTTVVLGGKCGVKPCGIIFV